MQFVDILVEDEFEKRSKHLPLNLVKNNCVNLVKYLIKEGFSPNTYYVNHVTPLHIAAEKGYLKMVKVLIGANAWIDAKDDDGYQPLHGAAQEGQYEVVDYLVRKKTDIINGQDYYDRTPIHIAAHYGYTNVVFLLRRLGAAVNVADR